jgi:hypothetical protein
VVVVIQGIDLIGLSAGGRPDLVLELEVLALLDGGIGLLGVALLSAVANNFVYHLEVTK